MHMVFRKSSLVLAMMMLLSCTACHTEQETDTTTKGYAEIVLGQDYTDLNVKLTMTTNRTDLINDDPNVRDYQDYKREFNEMYPDIDIIFEGFPDYDLDMKTRFGSLGWDICLIPADLKSSELGAYFEPFSEYTALADKYEFIYMDTWDNLVYGIPCSYNTQGIVYNKKVFADAGVTETPRTPEDFLAALRKIRANTDAVPLYTNYAAGWTLPAWDFYDAGAMGDGRYRYYTMPYETNPFANRGNGTGIYAIYNILYTAVSEGLIEDDPNATNWELCKASINNGEIGCMALGSWAVPQMQAAGNHPEDIGYMPFPITVDGVQYTTTGANYSYGINKNITDEKKLAAKIFVKYMIEKSGYAYDSGGISIVKNDDYDNTYDDFEGVSLAMEVQPGDGETDVFSPINTATGLAYASEPGHIARIIDAARSGSESLDDIMNEWNALWTEAQKQYLPENEQIN